MPTKIWQIELEDGEHEIRFIFAICYKEEAESYVNKLDKDNSAV